MHLEGRLCGVGGGAERRRAAGSVSPKDDVVCVAARGGEQYMTGGRGEEVPRGVKARKQIFGTKA